MRKYWAFFKCYLATVLEYRSIPVVWALIEVISLVFVIFLWLAVYRDQALVGNYSSQQMLFYYALVPLIGTFTYVYVSSSLPKQIKDGKISIDLIRPYNLAFTVFLRQVSVKVAQLFFKVPIFLFFVLILRASFGINFDFSFLAVAIIICLFSFVLHFLIDLCLSYAAFWIDDVWSLKHFKTVTIMVFSGMTFPLDLVPHSLRAVFDFLPFRFIYFFPISVARGDLTVYEIFGGSLHLMAWVLLFYVFSQFLWRCGLKKYQAYGN